ncbi:Fe-S cluster assembly protein HesB [uncultured Microbacterium sp.]|uniref:Fe-S cluster assembly iron-binding protein IscA n=1 Tax=uncultured Microbacterium sp. TaxID=191216 RepID=A0A1Y5PBN5_9MICO|nr:Fe-S cluster assembly protein HesB [uncultured Microbacterium sp.]SBS73551.1 conserved hypothetical protein [uncultured Microbacterium sp.]
MLTLTTDARTAVASIVSNAHVAETGGVRIADDGTGAQGFALSITGQPETTDTVVDDAGARVFLDAAAAAVLDDKVLDAAPDENGAVRFELLPQP